MKNTDAKRHCTKKQWIIVVFSAIIVMGFFASFILSFLQPRHRVPRDARRIADIKQLQLALEIYADKNDDLYPPLSAACADIEALESHLVPNYIPVFPKDSLASSRHVGRHPQYQIAVHEDRKSYVLKAQLEDTDFTALKVDLDGKILGCNCDDPNYCADGKIKDATASLPSGEIIPADHTIPSSFVFEEKFYDKMSGAKIIERKIATPPPSYQFSEPSPSWIFIDSTPSKNQERYFKRIVGDVTHAAWRNGHLYLVIDKQVAKTAYGLDGRPFNSWNHIHTFIRYLSASDSESILYTSTNSSYRGPYVTVSPTEEFAAIRDDMSVSIVIQSKSQIDKGWIGIAIFDRLIIIDLRSGEKKEWTGDRLAAQMIFDEGDIPVGTVLYIGNLQWSSDGIVLSGEIVLRGTGDAGAGMPPAPPLATSTFTINTANWKISF